MSQKNILVKTSERDAKEMHQQLESMKKNNDIAVIPVLQGNGF